jgi:ribosomal-protein-alanine N-acetyltransferase
MPNAKVRIRRARPGDLDALIALEERSFHCDLISRRMLRAHLTSPRSIVLVAERARAVHGDALVFLRSGSARARLYSIAVDATARGLGLGARLLAASENAARARQATHMRLEVDARNAAAIKLYESRGYARFAVKPGYYEDGGTAWRYEKPLTAPSAAGSARRAGSPVRARRGPGSTSSRGTPRARGTRSRT